MLALRRSPWLRSIVATSTIISFSLSLAVGCTSGGPDASRISAARVGSQSFSGEELFRGIFFGEGEVGARLQDMWQGRTLLQLIAARLPAGSDQQFKAIQVGLDKLVAGVKAEDPSFLDRFQGAIQSGRHADVAAAIQEAVRLMKETAPTNGGASDPRLRPDLDVFIVLVVEYAVAVYEIAVAIIAAVVVAAPTVYLTGSHEASHLQWDVAVDVITRALATGPVS